MEPLTRLTPATADVLHVLAEGHEGDGGVWGMLVIKRTGRPAGSVYPILERLEGSGWVSSSWEAETERRGPRRRLYELSAEGRVAARAALDGMAASKRRAGHGRAVGGAASAVGA